MFDLITDLRLVPPSYAYALLPMNERYQRLFIVAIILLFIQRITMKVIHHLQVVTWTLRGLGAIVTTARRNEEGYSPSLDHSWETYVHVL
jgi:hypothetical protein